MNRRSPWLFVPTLYFQQGLPVILVQQLSVLLYKKLGVANEQITFYTSLLAWPWIVKMLWGPLIDLTAAKRTWVIAMQAALSVSLFALAAAVQSTAFFPLTLAILLAIAFLSATHDIALDGWYLVALPAEQQAFFLGISNASFRMAWIFCTSALVVLAGLGEQRGWGVPVSWTTALAAGAACYGALALYASWTMPKVGGDKPARKRDPESGEASYVNAFVSFFSRPRAAAIVAFILVYRFGESMTSKMSSLFLLDPRSAGGLGFSTLQTGEVAGTCGVAALVAGGITGGIAVSRFGVRRCLWPMALAMHIPNLLYVWAARALPGPGPMYLVVGLDQFAYGIGLSSYMVYNMQICRSSRFQASHFAIATALMALGGMCAGMLSGHLQAKLGYLGFFVAACVCTLPGLALLPFLPEPPEPAR